MDNNFHMQPRSQTSTSFYAVSTKELSWIKKIMQTTITIDIILSVLKIWEP